MPADMNKPYAQFSLRSLLMGFIWLAFLLAICVQHQRATVRQRETIERLKAAGVWPAARAAGRPMSQPKRPAQLGSKNSRSRVSQAATAGGAFNAQVH